MNLRPYQEDGIRDLRGAFAQGHRAVLYQLATGGGKTVVFSAIAAAAAQQGPVCILVHRRELLNQASAKLAARGVPHGLIAAGRPLDLSQSVQVASVQTVARRLDQIPPDHFRLLIPDEAHHTNAGQWVKVLNHCRTARVLGVTATPCRTDGQGLGQWYQAMVLGPSPRWLTERGYLAPARVFSVPGFNATGLKRRMGDFDMGQAGQLLQQGQAMGDVLTHYRRHLEGRTAIAFCCSVAHAEAVAAEFNANGVPAASIDGRMRREPGRIEGLLADLAAGRIQVLTSCELIGEGVDVPSVGGCILLRPTQSLGLHLQMIGRCLRPQDGKTAVVIDHVGNYLRLGHHLDDQPWTLEGKMKRPKAGEVGQRVCHKCYMVQPATSARCRECGTEFRVWYRERKPEVVEGDLEELQCEAPPKFKVGDVLSYYNLVGRARLVEVVEARQYDRKRNAYYICRNIDSDEPLEPLQQGERLDMNPQADPRRRLTLNCFECYLKYPKQEQLSAHEEIRLEILRLKQANQTRAELERLEREQRARERAAARTPEALVAVGKARGMKNPHAWAQHVLAARRAKGGSAA